MKVSHSAPLVAPLLALWLLGTVCTAAADPVTEFIIRADSVLTAGGPESLQTWLPGRDLLVEAAVAQVIDVAVELGDSGDHENEAGNIDFVRALAAAHAAFVDSSAATLLFSEYQGWNDDARKRRRQAKLLEARADSVRGAGDPDGAVDLLLEASQLYEEIHDTHSRAVLYGSLGVVHWYRGDFEAVGTAYRTALALRRQVRDRILEGRTLNGMGSMHFSQGEFREAIRWYEQAAALRRDTGDLAGLGTSLTYEGHARLQLGQIVAARQLYEEALPVLRAVGSDRQVVENLIGTADLHDLMGRYGDAIAAYHEAIALCENSEECEYTGLALQNLAATLSNAGELTDAVATLEQAESHLDEMSDPATAARIYQNWASCALDLGDGDLARQKMVQSLAFLQRTEDVGLQCDGQAALASLYLNLGVLDRARTAASEALRLGTEMEDPSRQRQALVLMGGIALREGQGAESVEHFSAALSLDNQRGMADSIAEDLLGRGGAYSATGQYAAARADLRRAHDLWEETTASGKWLTLLNLGDSFETTDADSAAHWYARALDSLDAAGQSTGGAALNTGYLFADRGRAYEGIIEFYAAQDASHPGAGWDSRAYTVAERARARGLLELLEHSFSLEAGDAALAVIDSLYEVDDSSPSARDDRNRLQRRLAALRAEHMKDRLGDARIDTRPLHLAEVERRLPARTVLLQYALADSTSWMWVIDSAGSDLVALPDRAELERHVRAFRDAIAQPGAGDESLVREGRWLYEQLIGPAGARLDKADHLVLVPDAVLLELPFEALLRSDAPPTTGWSEQPFLGRDLAPVYAPSATVYLQLVSRGGKHPPYDGSLLAIGDADYTGLQERGHDEIPEPLPWTRQEVESISPPDGQAVILTGSDASETRLKDALREISPRVLHLATHGLVDPVEPARSCVALAASGEDDGYLHSLEILSLHLQEPLVVLSACESALGRLRRGEGVVGLTRSFLAAGAQGVVASLWPVSDESTAELMQSFYASLWSGDSAASALRNARQELLRSDQWAHPVFWAPFVVIGTGTMPW